MRSVSSAYPRRANLRLWLPGLWLGFLVILTIFAPLIAPVDPLEQDLFAGRLPPIWSDGADPKYLLGTDSLGRDVLSRLIYGTRIALTVALIAGVLTCLLGTIMGMLAGYYRGWADQVISRLIDIWMAFPPVLFAILLIAVMGTGLVSIITAIVIIDWTRFARVVRAETMVQSAMDYVDNARVVGRSRLSMLWTEILPNVLPTIGVMLTLEMGIALIVETILGFVNLSISTDAPTWGGMIAEGRQSIHQAWWVLIFPLLALFLTVLSLGQLGEGLKQRFDPVLR